MNSTYLKQLVKNPFSHPGWKIIDNQSSEYINSYHKNIDYSLKEVSDKIFDTDDYLELIFLVDKNFKISSNKFTIPTQKLIDNLNIELKKFKE